MMELEYEPYILISECCQFFKDEHEGILVLDQYPATIGLVESAYKVQQG